MTATNDKQRIVFEQGGPETGDSGERGNDTAADGGVESVKPVSDGERAHETVFNRPTENMRRRTETLRNAGEQEKYFTDQTRLVCTQGRDDGIATAPLEPLGQIIWNSITGIFSTTEDMVLQPLNTPATDQQEVVDYSFSDGINSGNIEFNLVPGAVSPGRAYAGANLLNIVWLAVPTGDLSGALIPGQADATITGDPDHILTISIRDDDQTQLLDVWNALLALGTPQLALIGLQYTVGGDSATFLEYGDITTPDYVFEKTFDRELHYIPTATFDDFFTGPPAQTLADGDTLAIQWEYFVEAYPGISGRRQSIPSNISGPTPQATTVLPSQLFITSDYPERIPLSIPLCKRVGNDLWWLDGTVIYGVPVPSKSIYFGEHGYTVERIFNAPNDIELNITEGWFTTDPPTWAAGATMNSAINGILTDLSNSTGVGDDGASEIGKAAYPDPGGLGWSANDIWKASAESVGAWLITLLEETNKCGRVANGEYITGTRWWRNLMSFEATPDDAGGAGTQPNYNDTVYNVRNPTISSHVKYATGNVETHLSRREHFSRGGADYYRNGPLSGLYTWAEQDNQLEVGSGVAWVGGHRLFCEGFTMTDVWGGTSKGGMTAASKAVLTPQLFSEVTYPLYVWMRVDGTVWLDIYGPAIRDDTTTPLINSDSEHWRAGLNGYYYPHPYSGLPQANYVPEDYALVDVCYAIQGNSDSGDAILRLGGYIPMGAGFRTFQFTQYRSTGPVYTDVEFQIVNNQDETAGTFTKATNYVHSSNKEIRCPGLPVVSNLARVGMTVLSDGTGTAATRSVVSFGLSGDDSQFIHPHKVPQAYVGSLESTGVWGPSVVIKTGELRYYQVAGDVWYYKAIDDYRTKIKLSVDHYVDSDPDQLSIYVYLFGFWWDKFSGPMVSHFQENILP